MANGGKAKTQPAGWGDEATTPKTPTVEDRLAALEGGTGQLTAQELIGVRALLERAGFDCERGSFGRAPEEAADPSST